jgi:PAS domain S-box-containing protein
MAQTPVTDLNSGLSTAEESFGLQFLPEVARRTLVQAALARRLIQAEGQARLSHALIEQIYTGVMITSNAPRRNPEIIYINPAFRRLTGLAFDTLVGQKLSSLEALAGKWQPLHRALAAGESFSGETEVHCRGGARIIADCTVTRVLDESGNHTNWAVLLRDVTERKESEGRQQLLYEVALILAGTAGPRESAGKILQAVCAAFDWCIGELWAVDATANVLRKICTVSSPKSSLGGWARYTATLSFGPGEGLPGRVWAARAPRYIADLTSSCDALAKLAQRTRLRSAFGFPIISRDHALGVLVFFARETCAPKPDLLAFITSIAGQLGQFLERTWAEEALRHSEANLASAQQIAHVGSYEMNVARTGPSHWSAESIRVLGLDPADQDLTYSQFINQVVHPEDRPRVRETFNRSISQGIGFNHEHRIVRSDGTIRNVQNIAEPVFGVDKKVAKMVGSLHDITERKRLEIAIGETVEREQQRIGQDLHDGLGQQLTAIELMCHSLRDDLTQVQPILAKDATRIGRLLQHAIRQTRFLAHGLVAYSVHTGGLQSALMELAQATSSSGRIKCRFRCPEAVTVQPNDIAGHLYRIAQEAVNNAVKHSQASEVTIRLCQRDGFVCLQVTDNGQGLPRTSKPAQGIGLLVMKHRAQTIDADLQVRSASGKGVTISCTLRRNNGA